MTDSARARLYLRLSVFEPAFMSQSMGFVVEKQTSLTNNATMDVPTKMALKE